MAFKFKIITKKNPRDLTAPPKYYGQIVVTNKRTSDNLAERIARATTMGVPDVAGVLKALKEEVRDALLNGESAELEGLCKFSPAITSTGTDTEDDFNALVNITRKTVRVRPSTELVRAVRDVTMDRLD